jgi:hypothetical protein
MTALEHGASPTALARKAAAGVSGAAVVGWLALFVGYAWLRLKLGGAASLQPADLPKNFSALEGLELFLLVRLFGGLRGAFALGAAEAAATLLGAGALLLAAMKPLFAAALLSLYLLARFGWTRSCRPFAIGVYAFVAQYWLAAGPFIWLHEAVGRIDAAVLRTLIASGGRAVAGTGTTVQAAPDFAVDVLVGCSSSYIAAVVGPAFVICVLGFRGALRRSDLVPLAGLLAAATVVNWLRLWPIALSRDNWLYWHEGAGATIVAAADALLAVGAAWLATRPPGARSDAA